MAKKAYLRVRLEKDDLDKLRKIAHNLNKKSKSKSYDISKIVLPEIKNIIERYKYFWE